MFLGLDFFSGKYSMLPQPIVTQEMDKISLNGGTYDHLYVSTNSTDDTVTITTLLLPWLDVNVKLDYKKQQEKTTYSYVVKSKSDNFADGTSTITMYRFLQLYE